MSTTSGNLRAAIALALGAAALAPAAQAADDD
jgi:hypothetical protein